MKQNSSQNHYNKNEHIRYNNRNTLMEEYSEFLMA